MISELGIIARSTLVPLFELRRPLVFRFDLNHARIISQQYFFECKLIYAIVVIKINFHSLSKSLHLLYLITTE